MKKITIQFICLAMVIMTLSVTETFAQPIKFKNGKAKISGKVTNVRHDTSKASGKVRFKLTGGQEGEPVIGSGDAEITFGKNKKIIKKMVIKFKGTRNGKRVNGILKTTKPIVLSTPLDSEFRFSNVVVHEEVTEI